MKRPEFIILKKDRKTNARLGLLHTPHGMVKTPAYVIVATHARVKCLKPADIKRTGTQIAIANAYHLLNAGRGAVRKRLGVRMPAMTDSGGFQVFSLGAAKEHGIGKVSRFSSNRRSPPEVEPRTSRGSTSGNIRITERGVHFIIDGSRQFMSPESSIKTQERLGADIIFAFDECTSPLHSQNYTKTSIERTHRWAERCLMAHKKKNQMLFGIVQGGRFKRLRTASAKTIGTMPFDGFGIGGSFGKDEMRSILATVIPYLPEDKPRHLLGIGAVIDIFDAIEAGVDLFDCVIPTREARHGRIYTNNGPIDVRKGRYAKDRTWSKLHRLFKSKDPEAGRLATIHNVRWFNDLLNHIRTALAGDSYVTFKRKFLKCFTLSYQ